jgi:hypothetical protein
LVTPVKSKVTDSTFDLEGAELVSDVAVGKEIAEFGDHLEFEFHGESCGVRKRDTRRPGWILRQNMTCFGRALNPKADAHQSINRPPVSRSPMPMRAMASACMAA